MRSLAEIVRQKLDELLSDNCSFLIGDADGVDSAFQLQLLSLNCTSVRVFYSGETVRNNVGRWPNRRVDSGYKSKGQAMHSAKDRFMGSECDIGFMVWDGKSVGTIVNVLDLLYQGKTSWFYSSPNQNISLIQDIEAFRAIVQTASSESWQQSLKRFASHQKKLGKHATTSLELDVDW